MVKKITKYHLLYRFISLFKYIFSLPLYWFSFSIPRSKNIWLFGAWFGYRFADNSRHVYEYIYEKGLSIRAIWLSRKRSIVDTLRKNGREAYLVSSLHGYWFSCRAAVVISSNGKADVNRLAISRAKKIQLWHGIPLKKIGLFDDISVKYSNHKFNKLYKTSSINLIKIKNAFFPFLKEKWDIITSTSPVVSKRMASAYCRSLVTNKDHRLST